MHHTCLRCNTLYMFHQHDYVCMMFKNKTSSLIYQMTSFQFHQRCMLFVLYTHDHIISWRWVLTCELSLHDTMITSTKHSSEPMSSYLQYGVLTFSLWEMLHIRSFMTSDWTSNSTSTFFNFVSTISLPSRCLVKQACKSHFRPESLQSIQNLRENKEGLRDTFITDFQSMYSTLWDDRMGLEGARHVSST